ncbi:MAG TPA: hypothetical protein VJM34_10030, partial [Novosphingobium sp.]|nr:hypothetical protein [Novosphingobium sp.]
MRRIVNTIRLEKFWKDRPMDLGLLYEFDVPQPWAGEHPWGQRMAERMAYRDNIEQIVLADKLGF